MKKGKRKQLFLGLVFLFLIFLTGCSAGSTIDSNLSLNEDLSGSRSMEIVIDQSVFNEYFTGSIDDLNRIIEEACPEEFTWNYSDENGVMKYDLELSFTSVEDYTDKVEKVLGREPEISISVPDSVWANGIYVSEDFTDQDLLAWMKDAIVNNGLVSEGNAGMIFSTGNVQLSYNGESFDAGDRIYIDTVEYIAINSIDILTSVNSMESYDRQVVFKIPLSDMNKKSDQIKAYMEEVTPTGADGSWGEEEYNAVFTVTAKNLDAAKIQEFDNKLFDIESCTVTAEPVFENYSPFSFHNSIEEQVDLANYIVGGYNYTRITYQVAVPEHFEVEDGSYEALFYESEDYPGYMILKDTGSSVGDALSFKMTIGKIYEVSQLNVVTQKPVFGDKWSRESTFTLAQLPTEEEQVQIVALLNQIAGNEVEEEEQAEAVEEVSETEAETEIEVSGTEEVETEEADVEEPEVEKAEVTISEKAEESYQIIIEQTGTPMQIEENSYELWGREGALAYSREKDFWKVQKKEAFKEEVSFGDMLKNITGDFVIDYTVKLGQLSKQKYCSIDDTEAVMKQGKLSTVFDGDRIDITYVGIKTDLAAIVFWIFTVVGIGMVVIALAKAGVLKPKAAKAAAPVQKPEAEMAATPDQKPEPEQEKTSVLFCENCGAKREGDAMFCEKCGSRFE